MDEPNALTEFLDQTYRRDRKRVYRDRKELRKKEKNKTKETSSIDNMTHEELFDYSIMLGLNLDQDISLKDLTKAIKNAGG